VAKARRVVSRGPYRMTARRRTALKKAQLVSARKRSRNKKLAVGALGVTAVVGSAVAYHKISGSEISMKVGRTSGNPYHKDNRHRRNPPKPNYARAGTFKYGNGRTDVFGTASVARNFAVVTYKHRAKKVKSIARFKPVPSTTYRRVTSNRTPVSWPNKHHSFNDKPKPALQPGTFTYIRRGR